MQVLLIFSFSIHRVGCGRSVQKGKEKVSCIQEIGSWRRDEDERLFFSLDAWNEMRTIERENVDV